jgi:N-acyl-D-aspartate/D-glutamate deacylase
LSLPAVIKMLSYDTAQAVGLQDRGLLKPGYQADVNVLDFDRLHLHAPETTYDLPGGGRRLVQRAAGYVATVLRGDLVYQDGVATGALPGRLVRGPQRLDLS